MKLIYRNFDKEMLEYSLISALLTLCTFIKYILDLPDT